MKKAIFLDRDGTIIKDKGYIDDVRDVEFYSYTFDSLRELQKEFLLFIVTNQAGISKGLIMEANVKKLHAYMLDKLKDNGIEIKEVYCCPHQKEDHCMCRKPNPYFINKAIEKYSIDITNSWVIGDHPSDMELAINACANGVLVLSGHGRKHFHKLKENNIEKIKISLNLKFATKAILKETLNHKR